MTAKTTPAQKCSNEPSPSTTSKPAGPWITPELSATKVEEVLTKLREVKQMQETLRGQEKTLKAEVANAYMDGRMDHLRDEKIKTRFNYTGLSVSLADGKKTREWDPAVQSQIDELEAQIEQVKLIAESKRQFQEVKGPPTWRVNLSKPL